MKKLQLLDCTLRDGGYYNNWNYNAATLDAYFTAMEQLPVDIVEIGYRSTRSDQYLGELFYTPPYILEKAASLMPHTQKAIMLDEKDTLPGELTALMQPCKNYIQLVRIALAPHKLANGLALAARLKDMGYAVAFNIMYASSWQHDLHFLRQLEQLEHIDYLYLVDSLGAMFPAQLAALLQQVQSVTDIPLGFHGHNNLELALINTLTAIDNGCVLADATMEGMGRGAGNLKTELLLTVLSERFSRPVDFDALAALTESFRQLHTRYKWGTNLAYMLAGKYSIPQQEVMLQMNKRRYAIGNIIQRLSRFLPGKTEQANGLGQPLHQEPAAAEVFITGGGATVTEQFTAFEKLVQQKAMMQNSFSIVHASSRFAPLFRALEPYRQYYCLFGNEGRRLQSFGESMAIAAANRFLLPHPNSQSGIYIPPFVEQLYQVSPTSFAPAYEDSPLALSIQAALDLKATTIYLFGFDGYTTEERPGDIELFHENQRIIDLAVAAGIRLYSLTPTRYTHIEQVSVFRLL
jgi:4-hydroxy 2-oxovalerate aldolase